MIDNGGGCGGSIDRSIELTDLSGRWIGVTVLTALCRELTDLSGCWIRERLVVHPLTDSAGYRQLW